MIRIGITQIIKYNCLYKEYSCSLDPRWGQLLLYLGLIPVPIFPIEDKEYISSLNISGVIFSGGNTLSIFTNDKADYLRDNFEKWLLELYLKCYQLPILGVCRGAQLIAKYYGSDIVRVAQHVKTKHKLLVTKSGLNIGIAPGTIVNSYHNYGILNLTTEAEILCYSKDKTIEAFLITNVLGIMWHPEREKLNNNFSANIIKKFFTNNI